MYDIFCAQKSERSDFSPIIIRNFYAVGVFSIGAGTDIYYQKHNAKLLVLQ
jgi:hypothetical protein